MKAKFLKCVVPRRVFRSILVLAMGFVGLATVAAHAGTSNNVLYYALDTPAGFSDAEPGGYERAAGGQVVGDGAGTATGGYSHALLWSGAGGNVVDLNPSGFDGSVCEGTDGTQQVGWGSNIAMGFGQHAILWSGSAASAIDLNPAGFTNSEALGISGSQQVGDGNASTTTVEVHALLWNGSASSAIDLTPVGFSNCSACATDGSHQVGQAYNTATGKNEALLWSGSASSVVDLNPNGCLYSAAYGICGTQQVGFELIPAVAGTGIEDNGYAHALLWSGSANSAVDLNPSGFTNTYAYSTNGTEQVGYGDGPVTDYAEDAIFWSGTADSYIDLGSELPGYFVSSEAYSISGDTVYGTAEDASGNYYAVQWSVPVPEPASLSLFAIASLGITLRRRV